MPWFYFHLRGPKGLEQDTTGLELAGIEAAYLGACKAIPGMSADLIHEAKNPIRYSFEITDAAGRVLMEVPFPEVLDPVLVRVEPPSTERFRKGRTAMKRTKELITALRQEHAALQLTLSETRRLLEAADQARGRLDLG